LSLPDVAATPAVIKTTTKVITMRSQAHQNLALLLLTLLIGTGCTHQNPQDLRERTARATAELKRDTKAVASGIREGWNQYKTVDLNSATKEQLMTLPSVDANQADRIIAGRPYARTGDLVSRRIMSKKQYERISDLLKVQKS
jgi:DNA uptake protein ComE-like DNA-binding protein